MGLKKIAPSVLLNIAFTSAVVAALITSLFSYKAMRETNKQLLRLEQMRISSDINTFRYTRIYSALEEIQNLHPSVEFDVLKEVDGDYVHDKDGWAKTIGQSAERFSMITKLYDKVRPLINNNLLVNLEVLLKEEERQVDILAEFVYEKKELPNDVDVATISEIRFRIENELKSILADQVNVLTNQVVQEKTEKVLHAKRQSLKDTTTVSLTKNKEQKVDNQVKDREFLRELSDKLLKLQAQLDAEKAKNTLENKRIFLTIWSEVDTEILLDKEYLMKIDHSSGFDYTRRKATANKSSLITFKSKGFNITKKLFDLCDYKNESCDIKVGTYDFGDIIITEDQKKLSMGTKEDIPELQKKLLEGEKYSVRYNAANRLAYIGDKSAVPSLIKALEDKHNYVKACAAGALGDIGDITALPSIKKAYDKYEEKSGYGHMFESAMEKLEQLRVTQQPD